MKVWLISKDGWAKRVEALFGLYVVMYNYAGPGKPLQKCYHRQKWGNEPHDFLRPGEYYYAEMADKPPAEEGSVSYLLRGGGEESLPSADSEPSE